MSMNHNCNSCGRCGNGGAGCTRGCRCGCGTVGTGTNTGCGCNGGTASVDTNHCACSNRRAFREGFEAGYHAGFRDGRNSWFCNGGVIRSAEDRCGCGCRAEDRCGCGCGSAASVTKTDVGCDCFEA